MRRAPLLRRGSLPTEKNNATTTKIVLLAALALAAGGLALAGRSGRPLA